jgi:BirA family transcriptional regulator, biotin operon repressor / biotin---[acetyl-CoA-carboxylase] ligase
VNRDLILAGHTPKWLGAHLECHAVLPSTNDRARELLEERGPGAHGAVVLAEAQSAGRGRFGRTWESPPGVSLAMSVALWTDSPEDSLPLLTVSGSLAVLGALLETARLAAGLKWPNDVVCGEKKIAGVLLEGRWSGGKLDGLVLGLGVNLRQKARDFPGEIRDTATSVLIESGQVIAGETFAGALLRNLEPLAALGLANPGALLAAASPHWVHRPGDPLEVSAEGEVVRGTFVEVAKDGALVLDRRGERVAARYGDARNVRSYLRPRTARGEVS